MMNGNVKLALSSIRSSKWRSFLTMLGIIIGVTSVITTVSLGEGVKNQVSNQSEQFGEDLITIRPASTIKRDKGGNILNVNLFDSINAPSLTDEDVKIVAKTEGVNQSAPLSLVSALPKYKNNEYRDGMVIGTSYSLADIMQQKVQYGNFFTIGEEGRNVAVLGKSAAEKLFGENVPVGKSFTMRNQEFIVRGVFEEFENNPVTPDRDYNQAVFIPYLTGKTLLQGNAQVFEIFVKPTNIDQLATVKKALNDRLLLAHDNQPDFTILTQGQSVEQTSETLSMITTMVAGVAAISLFVGGIGIMNIMLVSVTERTREIGVRKAIGATNRQIMGQFLTEAIILSIVGSIIGVISALIINLIVRVTTDLEPALNIYMAATAVGVALLVGIIFGIVPAYKAARKEPIEFLRYQ